MEVKTNLIFFMFVEEMYYLEAGAYLR